MYNLLIPIAGEARRFKEAGYTAPKPLIMVKDKHMIELAMSCINTDKARLIFCVRKEHIQNFSLDKILMQKFGKNIKIVVIDKLTRGTLETCRLAENLIDNDDPLCIYTPDIFFQNHTNDGNDYYWHSFNPLDYQDSDGYLVTFKANSPAHSYVRLDETGNVIEVAEKQVIGEYANIGVYGFKSGHDFIKYSDMTINNHIQTNGEFYIAPMYNFMINDGKKVIHKPVTKVHVLGTPEDLEFYVNFASKRFGDTPVALCSDHSGYHAKELMKRCFNKYSIPFLDFGTFTESDCDQFDFLSQVLRYIKSGQGDFGMSFCRTGQAMNIGANYVKGFRSALVYDNEAARYAIKHNCSNFFSIPAILANENMYSNIVTALRYSSFDGGRHTTRLRKLEGLRGF